MTEAVQKMIYPRYAVIRIRGIPTTPRDIATALNLLRLRRKFTMVVVPGTPDVMGMIERANDWIYLGRDRRRHPRGGVEGRGGESRATSR
jgi:LSU ribosomal protein L30P